MVRHPRVRRLLDVLQSPYQLRHFHAVMTLVWLLSVVPTLLWWRDSVLWVALMSVWANVAAHWSAWQASRAETNQDTSS